ncbi:MAG: replication initiator protein A [Granulicatella sp.]|nr:replication initiator protein A [Granulicatella sp.]
MVLNEEQKELILSNRVKANIYEKAKQRFLMLPAGLAYGELYKDLSSDSKFAWTILNDRAKLSKQNGWYDEDGSIYFIFSNNDLVEIIKQSEPKIIKIKKELIEFGLLEQRRMGRGLSNRLYIYEPVLTKTDLHLMINQHNEHENLETLDNTKNLKILSSRTKNYSVLELNNFKPNNNNINNNNINITESAKAESHNDLFTNQYFKNSKLLTDYRTMGIPEFVTNELYRATHDNEKIGYICGVIFQAKRYVTNQKNYEIYLEELTEDDFKNLTKCILRALKKDLTERKIESFDRYLFVTIQKFFENYVAREKAEVPLIDWNS